MNVSEIPTWKSKLGTKYKFEASQVALITPTHLNPQLVGKISNFDLPSVAKKPLYIGAIASRGESQAAHIM
jgi:hypothetical protein